MPFCAYLLAASRATMALPYIGTKTGMSVRQYSWAQTYKFALIVQIHRREFSAFTGILEGLVVYTPDVGTGGRRRHNTRVIVRRGFCACFQGRDKKFGEKEVSCEEWRHSAVFKEPFGMALPTTFVPHCISKPSCVRRSLGGHITPLQAQVGKDNRLSSEGTLTHC